MTLHRGGSTSEQSPDLSVCDFREVTVALADGSKECGLDLAYELVGLGVQERASCKGGHW